MKSFLGPLFTHGVHNQSTTIHLLLERGASLDTLYKDKTAFQAPCLFERYLDVTQASLIEVFLEYSQDPDTNILREEEVGTQESIERISNPLSSNCQYTNVIFIVSVISVTVVIVALINADLQMKPGR